MKKLSSNHTTIKFAIDSSNTLEITPDGIIVSDENAAFVYKRLGDANVSVENVEIEKAVESVLSSVEALASGVETSETITPEISITTSETGTSTEVVESNNNI